MSQPAPAASSRTRWTQIRIYAACLLFGFLLGIVPTGISLVRTGRERDAFQQQLQRQELELHLAAAAVMARHGDYATAREAASHFFSVATQRLDAGGGLFTPAQRSFLQSALADRDNLITLLARGDPAGAERTTTAYVGYRAAFPR